jgi:hypothetical protein
MFSPYIASNYWQIAALAAVVATSAAPAQAILVSDTSGFGNPIVTSNYNPIPNDTFSPGPLLFETSNGDLVEFTSTNTTAQGGSVINYSGGYGFDSNGLWDSGLSMAGLNAPAGYMDFKFLGNPVSAVGGFLNYAPGNFDDMYISALDINGNILESYDLSFSTSGFNSGASFYIQRNSFDIATFRVGDSYAGIANFTYNAVPVPGPLPILGVAASFGYSRKLRKRIKSSKPEVISTTAL